MITLLHPEDGFVPAATLFGFLRQLPGPTALVVPGRDPSRCRLLVTLQHGNEPSGLKAIHDYLVQGKRPAVTLVLVIASVVAARTEPAFYHRMLPGQRDLNRCYRPPYRDTQGHLASAILQLIDQFKPEAVVDLHNTSGSGPAFSVTLNGDARHQAVVSHFCQRMIVTELRMGALMEVNLPCPVVTVEAGGAQDAAADRVAFEGLLTFAAAEDLFEPSRDLDVLRHPRRLELEGGSRVAYADGPLPAVTLTLDQSIEEHNFGVTPAGHSLGWLPDAHWPALQMTSSDTRHRLEDYFAVENGQLVTRQALRLFMVTTRPDIALSDCLFYFVPEQEQPPAGAGRSASPKA